MNARDEARALLPENYTGWDCDGSTSICDKRVDALRALLDEPVPAVKGDAKLPQNPEPVPAGDRMVLERIVSAAVYGDPDNLSRATQAIDEILAAGFRRQGPITDAHDATYDGTYRCSVCLAPVTTEFDTADRAHWVHVEDGGRHDERS